MTYDVVAEIFDDIPSNTPIPPTPALRSAAPVGGSAAVAAAAPPPRSAPPAAGAGEIRAPLSGKVVSIDAAPGASVAAGQTVLTLEAMKMNTLITTPAAGTVAAVHVRPGDGVEEGQLLMQIG
ncbi:MAG: acetyl-CoA carboxylase biotin carboxyl carrier protein subunit [Rubrivivax sp.]|nr:acetyl-CoA carboxylase biotin carboxyl carrier protein subunit [Rubrivivax sp.]